MERQSELKLGLNLVIALLIFALGSAFLRVAPDLNSPMLHTILDTSNFLLCGILALLLWDISARTRDPFPRLLALAFATLSLLELVHTIAALEVLAGTTIGGVNEIRWRAGTWGPTTHILPIALGAILLLPPADRHRSSRFAAGLMLLSIALFVAFEMLPRYTPPGWLGITRPYLVLAPVLWALVGFAYWRRRNDNDLTRALAFASILLLLANTIMLYSRTANDGIAMAAHLGKLLGHLFLLVSFMQMGAIELVRRLHAEHELRQLNEGLEQRVSERTVELERANAALTAENQLREQVEKKLQIQLERLNLLHQITRAIGEHQDLQSIFQVVVRSLEDQLRVDFACIYLHDPVDHVLTVSNVGIKSKPLAAELAMAEKARIAIDENGLSRCVKGHLVYEPDIGPSPFRFPRRLAQGGLRALVVAPITIDRSIFGVLGVARTQTNSFSSSDCEFLRQLSEHVALAANQAQLRKTLQAAYDDLRQTQQAVMQQERLRALGQMASGIAHDINNAISPMGLYTESVLESEPNLNERVRSCLETVKRVTNDVAATVGRMREFYREREPQLNFMPMDINPLAEQVIELTRARWGDMPQRLGIVIDMRKDLAVDLPQVMGVESEIREALTNLIFNAVDAMPAGGTVTVRTRQPNEAMSWRNEPGPRRVHLEVADSGVGMDEETRRRAFEPFFTTKGERGTGLGLAMVYGTAQRHGADLEIDSAVGKGTTIRLTFAAVAAAVPAATRPTPKAFAVPPLHLLIVDDDPFVLDSMRKILVLEKHTVTTATDGQACLDAFRLAQAKGERFDAVITDLGMPYMDGNAVARGIKQMSPRTPVILLTGWGQQMSSADDDTPHVDHVLGKPARLNELREALADCAARRAA